MYVAPVDGENTFSALLNLSFFSTIPFIFFIRPIALIIGLAFVIDRHLAGFREVSGAARSTKPKVLLKLGDCFA